MNRIHANRLKPGQHLVLAKLGPRREASKASDQTEPVNLAVITEGDDLEEDEAASSEEDWTLAEKEKEESAALLGKWNSPDERLMFAKVATGFLGAPYRFGGSSVRGIDCSAFVRKIYEFFNINLPRTARKRPVLASVSHAVTWKWAISCFSTPDGGLSVM